MENQNNETISIEEFVETLPGWGPKYIESIPMGKDKPPAKMIGVKGANKIAAKCGISITAVEVIDETDDYITVVAASLYRDRTDYGSKRQQKKGSIAPFENAVSKARRKAIVNMVPEQEIIDKTFSNDLSNEKYVKAAKAIEKAELEARSVAGKQGLKLNELGTSVKLVSEFAQKENGQDTTLWGVNDWNRYKDMLENPKKWHLEGSQQAIPEDGEEDDVELDESDMVDETDDKEEEIPI